MTRFICLILMSIFSVTSVHAKTADQRVKKVLLVVGMDKEAAPIIDALQLKKTAHSFSGLPMQAYAGKYKQLDLFLILNGQDPVNNVQNVGTQAAALSTYLGIKSFHPDLIVNIGTAGGIPESGAKIGDVYVSKKIYFYARRMPIPGYREYGIGNYESASYDSIANKIGLKTGMVCTGDNFDENETDTNVILQHNCAVKEMEAASVAWVSMLTKTPMIAMKGITDMVGNENSHEDFKKNFALVANKLSEMLRLFLDELG